MAYRASLAALMGQVAFSDLSCLDEASMLQMPLVEKTLEADECRCPGYKQLACEAEHDQGCRWSDMGSSNAPWCQCLGEPIVGSPQPVTLPPLPGTVAPQVSLRNGNLEEGLQAGVGGQFAPDYEYTHNIAGWTGSGGTVVCLSGNAPWGAVVSEGSYYLALQASGAAIEQSVSGHRIGHQYTLRLSAAQRQNSPGGRNAVLKITANGVELLNELITSATFAERVVTYTATSASVAIRLENIAGSGDQTVFVDDMRLAPQVDPRSAVIQVDGCYDQGADPHRVVSHESDGRTAAIRCCSLAGDACPISGACTGGQVLFAAAFNDCDARGLRLCTQTEIETRVCCSTGCGPGSDQIWVGGL